MNLESFVERSEGQWRSMRSGHSLAFQQFEEVLSQITIERLSLDDPRVQELLEASPPVEGTAEAPFAMAWNAESDWEPDDPSEVSAGSCVLVPIAANSDSGSLLRSVGYAEAEQAVSTYQFLSDGTFVLNTRYGQSIAEERIWFVSEHVRCRSSVLRTSEGSGVLQTSFASEVRRLSV
jgi:phycoerythrin-associated linker protein